MTDADLARFLDAQSDVYDEVTKELTQGRKQTHWMWFIFPQLAGLGRSAMAREAGAPSIAYPMISSLDPAGAGFW